MGKHSPLASVQALEILNALLYLPRVPYSGVDPATATPLDPATAAVLSTSVCRAMTSSQPIMTGLAAFGLRYAAAAPASDLEWAGRAAAVLFDRLACTLRPDGTKFFLGGHLRSNDPSAPAESV